MRAFLPLARLGLLVVSLGLCLAAGVAAAQPMTGPAPLQAPPTSAPPAAESRLEEKPQRPPVSFTIAPDSEAQQLLLYEQRAVNPTLTPDLQTVYSHEYTLLCEIPCALKVRSGLHVFALSAGTGHAIPLDRALKVRGGDRVAVHYRRRWKLRAVGWALALSSVGGAIALSTLAAHSDQATKPAVLVPTSASLLGALIGGLWLAHLRDRASGFIVAPAPGSDARR